MLKNDRLEMREQLNLLEKWTMGVYGGFAITYKIWEFW
jgi:hypothetical protein